jgi:hypothetical protein
MDKRIRTRLDSEKKPRILVSQLTKLLTIAPTFTIPVGLIVAGANQTKKITHC